jgi:hypothetical protein
MIIILTDEEKKTLSKMTYSKLLKSVNGNEKIAKAVFTAYFREYELKRMNKLQSEQIS